MRSILEGTACGLALLLAVPAHAGPVTFITRSPADPARIPAQVDESQLEGTLAKADLTDLIEAGRQLFDTRFTSAEGAGRPLATQAIIPTHFKHAREDRFQRASGPEANSCTGCHNIPKAGGAGDFVTNVFTSGGTESADFDNVDPQFSNERGTTHLFGAGVIELLAREMTADLQAAQAQALATARKAGQPVTVPLETKGVSFGKLTVTPDGMVDTSGIDGVDEDLVVRPFSQKGVFTSIRSFSVGALNAHMGMQADERFSGPMTGEADFDGDGFVNEFSPGLVSAMVAYQASLEPPEPAVFENKDWEAAAMRGKQDFAAAKCDACHIENLPLKSLKFEDPGPYDTAGTLNAADVPEPAVYDLADLDWANDLKRDADGNYLIPLFGDLKRHVIADPQHPHFANELLSQSFAPQDAFITAELWGVASTAPYGHRGDLTTLQEVILAHGGEATESRDAFASLSQSEQDDLVTYLMTLRLPQ